MLVKILCLLCKFGDQVGESELFRKRLMYTVFLFEVGRDGKLWLACKSLTSVQRDAVALLVSLTAFHLPPALVV